MTNSIARPDVNSRITDKMIADLERGVRPWLKPWDANHAAGRITRPLRHNGIPYKGIKVVMLWSASVAKGYACTLYLTFKQAVELGGYVKEGEIGELGVSADPITRTETDAKGAEIEKAIPFLKGYTTFNAEQSEGLCRPITLPRPRDPHCRASVAPNEHRRRAYCAKFGAIAKPAFPRRRRSSSGTVGERRPVMCAEDF